MKAFLEYVAEDILAKHGSNLPRIAVVFPNKRASLFLSEYLARLAGKPIWSPAYITISQLFRRHSQLNVADPIKLVCDLHRSFTAVTGSDETLDHFYGWGQLLISDFDDIDKNMADADRVLANLRDLHELDDLTYLTKEQKESIHRFFKNFTDDHNTLLRERFIRLWSHLADVYHDFNHRLRQQHLAYEGTLYREVADQADNIVFNYDTYIFVGFNLLQKVEQKLFTALKRQGKARFYWDFDHSYLKKNEAGMFIDQYLSIFPNELDIDNSLIYHQSSEPKHITIVSAPTENIQARYAGQWLKDSTDGQLPRLSDGRQTAIVLCNENLLPTIIHCLPDEVDKVNITTGYPLSQTLAASLVVQLVELRTTGYDQQRQRFRKRQVSTILRHPYISDLEPQIEQVLFRPFNPLFFNHELLTWLCDVVKLVARQTTTTDALFQESVFRTYTLLNRLLTLIADGDLQADIITLQRLLTQLLQTTSIPFHGEPAEGIQVMGVLETRNLDFTHLLLLSASEGNLPRGISDTSVIPYSLRKAYGLTTADHRVALYSYYFYRLLQRAEDVTIVYNNATTDGQRGEMSRFLLQLIAESPQSLHFETLQAAQTLTPFTPPTIEKDPQVMQKLMQRFALPAQVIEGTAKMKPLLTPTAINCYQLCQLKFYYRYVKDLFEPDTNDDESIDNRIFGNIFHEAARTVYTKLMQKSRQIVAADIDQLLKTKVDIERAVDDAMRSEYFQLPPSAPLPSLDGLQIINREVIIHYLRQLLTIDRRLAPFTIIGLEEDVVEPLHTRFIHTAIGGRIDRLDRITDAEGDRIRVIDYKTGAVPLRNALSGVEAIFQQENLNKHSDYYLQTFLYAAIVSRLHASSTRVSPALLFIQHAGAADYDPTLCFGRQPITDVAQESQQFDELLAQTVDEMFNPDLPFTPTSDESRCQNCPYYQLCSL